MSLKGSICCSSPHSCLTSGTHMAALRQTYLAQFCHPAHLSQTSHSTVHLCLTPQRDSTWTNPTPTTFMKSPGPSMRVGVSSSCSLNWFDTEDLTYEGVVFQVRSTKRWRCTCWGRRPVSASASWAETRPCRLWVWTPATRLVWDGLDLTRF